MAFSSTPNLTFYIILYLIDVPGSKKVKKLKRFACYEGGVQGRLILRILYSLSEGS